MNSTKSMCRNRFQAPSHCGCAVQKQNAPLNTLWFLPSAPPLEAPECLWPRPPWTSCWRDMTSVWGLISEVRIVAAERLFWGIKLWCWGLCMLLFMSHCSEICQRVFLWQNIGRSFEVAATTSLLCIYPHIEDGCSSRSRTHTKESNQILAPATVLIFNTSSEMFSFLIMLLIQMFSLPYVDQTEAGVCHCLT